MRKPARSQAPVLTRSVGIDMAGFDEKTREVAISFSSETTDVKRFIEEWDRAVPEILLHEPDSADLSWIEGGGSVLMNHDANQIVGSPRSVRIDPSDRRGKCIIRFSTEARGNEAYGLVRDGSLKGVSFGYEWRDAELIPDGETFEASNGVTFSGPCVIVKRWRVLEITLTPIPADVSVGVGRSTRNAETGKGRHVSLKQMVSRECLRNGLGLRAAADVLAVAENEDHAKELIASLVAEKRSCTIDESRATATAQKALAQEVAAADAEEEDEETPNDEIKRSRPGALRRGVRPDPVRHERLRVIDIQSRCKEANLSEDFANDLIERGVSIETACLEISNEVRSQGVKTAGIGGTRGGSVEVGAEAADKKMRFIEAGIFKRLDPEVRSMRGERAQVKVVSRNGEEMLEDRSGDAWSEYARSLKDFEGDAPLAMHEYARMYLEAIGTRNVRSMNRSQICEEVFMPRSYHRAAAANITASLPNLMANVLEKKMLALWKRTDPTWTYWCTRGNLNDYKQASRIIMSDTGDLVAMTENGIIPDSQITDTNETIQLKDFGRGISLTHQMFINDDLNALSTLTARMTQAALRLPTKLVYTKLLANPTLNATGTYLFTPGQNNLYTGGGSALGIAGLKQGLIGFAKQTAKVAPNDSQSTAEPLNLEPAVLLVPPELAKDAFDLVNPNLFLNNSAFYKNKFTVVVEPRLSTYTTSVPTVSGGSIVSTSNSTLTTGWYLMADPTYCSTMEVGFLNGSDKPMMRQIEKPDRLALDMQIVLPCGVAPLDYRGMQWNLGA